ncbi:MAG: signal peptidase I [Treponema sp.]|jgi:signal peptidase I|nr:signal peptidase I [Treponema sp.]
MKAEKTSDKIGRAILGAFLAALLMKIFLFDFMIAEGNSMLPAINPGAVLLVNKLSYGLKFPLAGSYIIRWAKPKKGDIVIFYTPRGELAVKRCAGLISGTLFLAYGDNGMVSLDSHFYGPVPVDNIVGQVLGIK